MTMKLTPQNSRSLWAKLSEQWELLDSINPEDPTEVNGSKLATIDRAVKLAEVQTKIVDTEIKLAIARISMDKFEEKFRNPQLKNYDNLTLEDE